MIAEKRNDIASSVQLGLVLPQATRAMSIPMLVNIRLWEADASRLFRSWQALRYRSLVLPISFANGAQADSAGYHERRHQGAAPDTLSRLSPLRSSRQFRRPCSALRRRLPTLPTQGSSESFRFFPILDEGRKSGAVARALEAGPLGGRASSAPGWRLGYNFGFYGVSCYGGP